MRQAGGTRCGTPIPHSAYTAAGPRLDCRCEERCTLSRARDAGPCRYEHNATGPRGAPLTAWRPAWGLRRALLAQGRLNVSICTSPSALCSPDVAMRRMSVSPEAQVIIV